MAWTRIIPLYSCRIGGGTFVEAGRHELAVFRFADPDRVIVIENACPHSSGNLSGGEVREGIVTCPLHQWQFELATGVCTSSDLAHVARYVAEIHDGFVWAELP